MQVKRFCVPAINIPALVWVHQLVLTCAMYKRAPASKTFSRSSNAAPLSFICLWSAITTRHTTVRSTTPIVMAAKCRATSQRGAKWWHIEQHPAFSMAPGRIAPRRLETWTGSESSGWSLKKITNSTMKRHTIVSCTNGYISSVWMILTSTRITGKSLWFPISPIWPFAVGMANAHAAWICASTYWPAFSCYHTRIGCGCPKYLRRKKSAYASAWVQVHWPCSTCHACRNICNPATLLCKKRWRTRSAE